ncbi:uncharacterized protein ASPGLDRAFT_1040188 [Aspergillus glaucus CBS 516.65]|uniref:Rhodopsin domain-containing protein n=1 Tax=Aspergillus glaucus CBS 516.65 TaxID=1160497 RepID=A0A1L9V6J4_ASPGL|nr:hypothetical protein ASPGLDRAFT_1040188 [Aspergillus glaucus CBS 516.65]OJJ79511.1 hypothetical protein ASPGLDRAFT_1040188 [Aspergillus glaucus CBS 516.65]
MAYILAVWVFEGVLVFLYTRLTMGLWQHRLSLMVKPYAGDNCTIRPLNYIVIEVLSIITDLAVMCVPIPLIVVARIPIIQKMILVALFCSSIFIMICAALRAHYSITDINTLVTTLGWASHECFVSLFIVCAPDIMPSFGGSARTYPAMSTRTRNPEARCSHPRIATTSTLSSPPMSESPSMRILNLKRRRKKGNLFI